MLKEAEHTLFSHKQSTRRKQMKNQTTFPEDQIRFPDYAGELDLEKKQQTRARGFWPLTTPQAVPRETCTLPQARNPETVWRTVLFENTSCPSLRENYTSLLVHLTSFGQKVWAVLSSTKFTLFSFPLPWYQQCPRGRRLHQPGSRNKEGMERHHGWPRNDMQATSKPSFFEASEIWGAFVTTAELSLF